MSATNWPMTYITQCEILFTNNDQTFIFIVCLGHRLEMIKASPRGAVLKKLGECT